MSTGDRRPKLTEPAPPSVRAGPLSSPSGAPSSKPASMRGVGRGDGVRRIIVIDDNPAIHDDFRKILNPSPLGARAPQQLDAMETELFGAQSRPPDSRGSFEMLTALQGREGCDVVGRMTRIGRPVTLAFVDMRMPPGMDGVETTAELWTIDPEIEVVICSAYSDYSWEKVITMLKRPDLRLLRKPFETREVLHLAWELTTKNLRRRQGAGP